MEEKSILLYPQLNSMKRLLFLLLFVYTFQCFASAQVLTESNLPIIVINSNGEEITADGRVDASMKIYFKEDGSTNSINDVPNDFDGSIGIKLRGQTSLFLFDKKSYSVETRDAEGQDSTYNLLGMPKESDWVLHGPFSDKSLMRNALLYTMADDILAYSPRVQMVEIVVNDDYKGVYLFTEKIKRDDSRVDISKLKDDDIDGLDVTGGYILKFDKADQEEIGWMSPYSISEAQPTNFIYDYPSWDDIVPEQKTYIQDWMTQFENVLSSNNFADPDEGYSKYINVESFIDHMLLNELSRNVDGYRLSTYMYKTKDKVDDLGQLYMGPVWDYNLAFGNAEYCRGWDPGGWAYNFNEDCSDDYWQVHFWWKRLLEDPIFAEEVKQKWMKLRNGKFSNPNINAWIDGFEDQLEVPQARNFERWPVLGIYVWPNKFIGDTYKEEVDYLRGWLMERLEWMDQDFDIELSVETDFTDEQLQISPNPAIDILELRGEVVKENMTYEIISLTGKQMFTGTVNRSNQVDINELPRGTFFFHLMDEEKSYVIKFVKI
jgi:hypothetical protein